MNNAAYLAHAEYARWEWTAETGALETMYKNNINFIATSVSAIAFGPKHEPTAHARDCAAVCSLALV